MDRYYNAAATPRPRPGRPSVPSYPRRRVVAVVAMGLMLMVGLALGGTASAGGQQPAAGADSGPLPGVRHESQPGLELPADLREQLTDAAEVVDGRGRYRARYRFQGRVVDILTATPQHVRDAETGAWVRVDATIGTAPGGPGFAPRATVIGAQFPAVLTSQGVVYDIELRDGSRRELLTLALDPALTVDAGGLGTEAQPLVLDPALVGPRTVQYADASSGGRMHFTAAGGAIRQLFLMIAYPSWAPLASAETLGYRQTVRLAAGLTLAHSDGEAIGAGEAVVTTAGALLIVDGDGAAVAAVAPAWVRDAEGVYAPGARHRVRALGEGLYELTVLVDAAWLAAPGRVWPVTFDPTIGERVSFDTFVDEGQLVTNFAAAEGLNARASTSAQRARTLFKFVDVTEANFPSPIVDANFHAFCFDLVAVNAAYQLGLYQILMDWTSTTVTWSTFPGAAVGPPVAEKLVATDGWHTWTSDPLTDYVEGWRRNAETRNRGFALSYGSNRDHNSFSRWAADEFSTPGFQPYMSIVYSAAGVDLVDHGEASRSFTPRVLDTGDLLTIQTDVRNTGSFPSGDFDVEFYASANGNLSPSDVFLGRTRVTSISAGDFRTVSLLTTMPRAALSGTYNIGWIIDARKEVTETDELNNVAIKLDYRLLVRDAGSRGLAVACGALPAGNPTSSTTGRLPNLLLLVLGAIGLVVLRRLRGL